MAEMGKDRQIVPPPAKKEGARSACSSQGRPFNRAPCRGRPLDPETPAGAIRRRATGLAHRNRCRCSPLRFACSV